VGELAMKVKFTECSDAQVRFGSGSDPREHLVVGEIYEVTKKEVHSWHTLYYIMVEGVDLPFNSVCFCEVK